MGCFGVKTPAASWAASQLGYARGLAWEKRMSVQDPAPPAPFTNDDVKTSDLDFDKRMDVVMSTPTGYQIWFNVEEGKYSKEVRTAGAPYQGRVIQFSQTGYKKGDILRKKSEKTFSLKS